MWKNHSLFHAPLFRLQVADQSNEHLFELALLLPIREVTNMSCAPNIPSISARRSASSACCTAGVKNSNFTRMYIAWCRRGGLSADHTRWIKPRYDFFLPVEVLGAVFRGKFHEALKRAFRDGKLNFHGDLKLLAQPRTFAAWLRPVFRKDWVVYAKRPFGGPEYVLRYLGRYTHRVAISNHRLVSFADGKVTFRWRDSAHNNEQKLLTLAVDEFLRRFLLHLLPQAFVRIRNFGFLANRRRATTLPLCFQLLGSATQAQTEVSTTSSSDTWLCPECGGPMLIIERLAAAELQLRSPPAWDALAA
jgi:Putative transposase